MPVDTHRPPETRNTESRTCGTGDRRLRLAALALLAVALLAGGAWLLPTLEPMRLIEGIGDAPGYIAVLLVGMMILHNFVPIPAEAIAICAGATLGIAAGAVTIWIGAMLGAAIAFGLSRRYGRRLVESRAAPGLLARIDRSWQGWGAPGLIGLRLVPLISFNLVNYGAGLTSVGWWTFLWTTAVGILPVLVLSVAAGAGLHARVMGPTFYIVLGLLCLGVGLARHLQRRRQRGQLASVRPDP